MLDETSRVIGSLESKYDGLKETVDGLKSGQDAMNEKLDKLIARQSKLRLSVKHWVAIVGMTSLGGGGVAHALRKIFE